MSTRKTSGRDPMDSMPLHIGDWMSSETVALLGAAGETFYLRLLMHQWKNEGDGLPADPEMLRRLSGASPKEWRECWALVERHLPVCDDGRRRNTRTENERQFALDRRAKRSAAGIAGNTKRWHSDQEPPPDGPDSDGDGIAMRSQSPRKPVAGPSQNHRPSPSPSLSSSDEEETRRARSSSSAFRTVDLEELERVLNLVPEPKHRDGIRGYVLRRPAAKVPAIVATLEALGPNGIHATAHTWYQLGRGVFDAIVANDSPTVSGNMLRGCIGKAPTEPEKPKIALMPNDEPGTVRDQQGKIVWDTGYPEWDRPTPEQIAANGWSVAA